MSAVRRVGKGLHWSIMLKLEEEREILGGIMYGGRSCLSASKSSIFNCGNILSSGKGLAMADPNPIVKCNPRSITTHGEEVLSIAFLFDVIKEFTGDLKTRISYPHIKVPK